MLRIQTRLIRYLVERHGLRLIVWENPTLRSLEPRRLGLGVHERQNAGADRRALLPHEIRPAAVRLDLRIQPRSPRRSDRVPGHGYWDRPWEHYARIRALSGASASIPLLAKNIETLCPAYELSSWPEIDAMFGPVSHFGKFVPEADYEKCRAALTALLDASRQSGLDKQKRKDPGADDAFELAISASTILGWLGFINYNWSSDVLSWNARDEAQARNLMLVMEKHNAARAILSAHTSHVSHNRSPADWWGFGDIKSGVYFFSRMTSKKVFNIAFTAYEASGVQGHWSLPTARNSLDKKLSDSGHAFSFFASDAAFLREHPKWWIQNQNYPGPTKAASRS